MRRSVLLVFACAAAAAAVLLPATARAQFIPVEGKIVVSANVGVQVSAQDLERNSTFDLYDEQASVDIFQEIKSGGFFDVGGQYKINKSYGVGLSYGFLSKTGDGTVSGSLPHPLFFDQPRQFNASATDLKRTEHSWHFQAVYYVPFIEKVDFAISGGPSLFNVKQQLIRNVNFSENPPGFTSVTIDSVDVVEPTDSGWGFNLGVDMTYALSGRLGVGAIVRYTYGNVEFNLSDNQTADYKAGGFQIGGGVRYKF
jgi:opacity protein-like surface antigen